MNFSEWLEKELEKRDWSYNELAKRAGLSSGYVSMVMTGQRRPKEKFCNAVARALNVPPVEVFRRAGILPPAPEETATVLEVVYLMSQLPPEEQERLLITARAWIEAREREKQRGVRTKPSGAII